MKKSDKNIVYGIIGIIILFGILMYMGVLPKMFSILIQEPTNYIGDCDGNGIIEGPDLLCLNQLVSGLNPTCTPISDCSTLDLNNNGIFDSGDMALMQSFFSQFIIGDCDNNGLIEIPDMSCLNDIIGGRQPQCLPIADCTNMDLNADGKYDAEDIAIIQDYLSTQVLGGSLAGFLQVPKAIEVTEGSAGSNQLIVKVLSQNGRGRSGIAIMASSLTDGLTISQIPNYVVTEGDGIAIFDYTLTGYGQFQVSFTTTETSIGPYNIPSVTTTYTINNQICFPDGKCQGQENSDNCIVDCPLVPSAVAAHINQKEFTSTGEYALPKLQFAFTKFSLLYESLTKGSDVIGILGAKDQNSIDGTTEIRSKIDAVCSASSAQLIPLINSYGINADDLEIVDYCSGKYIQAMIGDIPVYAMCYNYEGVNYGVGTTSETIIKDLIGSCTTTPPVDNSGGGGGGGGSGGSPNMGEGQGGTCNYPQVWNSTVWKCVEPEKEGFSYWWILLLLAIVGIIYWEYKKK